MVSRRVRIKCPYCEEEYVYSIHPASSEYIRCKECGSFIEENNNKEVKKMGKQVRVKAHYRKIKGRKTKVRVKGHLRKVN